MKALTTQLVSRNRVWESIVIFLLALVMLVSVCGCGGVPFDGGPMAVKYAIEGLADTADVFYRIQDGELFEEYDVELPWSAAITIPQEDFDTIYMLVIAEDATDLTARIVYEDVIQIQETQSGDVVRIELLRRTDKAKEQQS